MELVQQGQLPVAVLRGGGVGVAGALAFGLGGGGLGGVLTPAGVGTIVEDSPYCLGKQTIDGRDYLLMKPIHADFAVICGAKIDKAGNVWYKGNTSNFNLVMATAADTVIAEAEEIVEIGEIEPENVRTYGVFVDYVVEGGKL